MNIFINTEITPQKNLINNVFIISSFNHAFIHKAILGCGSFCEHLRFGTVFAFS